MNNRSGMCKECGKQAAMFHGLCEDCRDIMLDREYDHTGRAFSHEAPVMCLCDNYPRCGCV